MEALTFMKSWLSNPNGKPRREIKISDSTDGSSTALNDSEIEIYEGDDSFFELEISDFSIKHDKKNPEEIDSKQRHESAPFSVSKSKVLPFVDIVSRPHSPITLLKSGPKFRAFSFKKSKPTESEKSTTETLTYTKKESSRSLNVRFKIENGNSNETSSFRKTASIARLQQTDDTVFDDSASPASSTSSSASSSKRFFSLMKPFYSKKQSSIDSVSSSPLKQRSNIPSGIRSVRRQLGKSRSASATVGVMSPAKRIDETLQVQQDGIQSAILHCKKSFHGSRESSLLSRSTSESSSQEKLSTSSSEDSCIFSRIASDSMSETSTENLTSIKEQREKISD